MKKTIVIALFLAFLLLVTGCGVSPPSSPQETGVTVKVLDVGQGDAVLVRTPEQTILVDTGDTSQTEKLRAALRRERVRRIDKLIITHPHRDHIGGAATVFAMCDVKAVYDNGQPTSTNVYRDYLKTMQKKEIPSWTLRDGDVLDLGGGAIFHVLSPTQEMVDDRGMQNGRLNLNLNSIVGRLQYGTFSMLLTGDAEAPTEEGILARHTSKDFRCQVLKAGHHGSKTASSAAFLRAIDADAVLISCGAGNEYHCPHPSVIARYVKCDMDYYRTDCNGTITVKTNGTTYTIAPEKGQKNDVGAEP